jgi:hypothetical protein
MEGRRRKHFHRYQRLATVSLQFISLFILSSSVLVRLVNDTTIELDAGARVELDTSLLSWVLHNGTIIVVLAASPGTILHVAAASQSGSWSKVTQGPDDVVSLPTFLVFLEHGTRAGPSFAAYAQLPGAYVDAASADAAAAHFLSSVLDSRYGDGEGPFVCRSRANASMVWTVMGAFFKPSRLSSTPQSLCPSISTSAACSFMVALHTSGIISVTISNPNRESAAHSIVVVVRGVRASGPFCAPSPDGTAVTVGLPSGTDSGGSSTVSCSTV